MRRTEQRQGVRMLKLRDVLTRWEAGSLSQLEAAEIVGMSERSVRRWTRRFEEEGEDGLLDRRLGRRSGRAARSGALRGLHRQAIPRAPGAGPWLSLGRPLDQDLLAEPRLSGPGAAA